MYQIAFNTAITNLKRSKKNLTWSSFTGNEKDIADSPPDINIQQDTEVLYQAISYLNDIDKALIMLYLDKKGYEEISIILGISTKNVSVKLTRIRKKLRAIYNKIKA